MTLIEKTLPNPLDTASMGEDAAVKCSPHEGPFPGFSIPEREDEVTSVHCHTGRIQTAEPLTDSSVDVNETPIKSANHEVSSTNDAPPATKTEPLAEDAVIDHCWDASVVDPSPCLQYRPFPVDSFPEPVRRFVAAGAAAIGCDPSYIALPMLAVLAAAIGNTRRIQLKRGWAAPPIIWVAIVGESGTAKSPAFRLVMRPLHERQKKALQQHEEAMQQYRCDVACFEKVRSQWTKNNNSTQPPPDKPPEPIAERFIVSDTTVEALASVLQGNPRGVLLARDELAGWFGSFDRYSSGKGGADAAHWLSMFNGEQLAVDRKTGSPRTVYVPAAAVCVCGGIQPQILNRALGSEHRESGLGARFLLACPPRKPKRWTETDIDPVLERQVAYVIEMLYSLQPDIDNQGQPCPGIVQLSAAAKAIWMAFYDSHAREQASLVGDLSAVWSKMEEYAARLALIIHLTRSAAGDPTLSDPDVMDSASMDAGVRLVSWCKYEAMRVHSLLAESDEDRARRRLSDWISRRQGAVTARCLQQNYRPLRAPGAADAALQDLVTAGYGNWHSVDTTERGGRPTRVFRLHGMSTANETIADVVRDAGSVGVDGTDVSTSAECQHDEWGEI